MSHHLVDRRLGVNPVLVVQVDPVGVQPPQRSLDRDADVGRATVDHAWPAAGVGDHPELGGQHHLIAAASEGAADELGHPLSSNLPLLRLRT